MNTKRMRGRGGNRYGGGGGGGGGGGPYRQGGGSPPFSDVQRRPSLFPFGIFGGFVF